jgi:hypothetical protein
VCGTRPSGARTFSAISTTTWLAEKFSDIGFCDASRRGNHAGVFASANFEKRKSSHGWEKISGAENEISFNGICRAITINQNEKSLLTERFAEIEGNDVRIKPDFRFTSSGKLNSP